MKLFECCSNCKHSIIYPGMVFCDKSYQYIDFPRFMGGSRKCECYERWHMFKIEKFQYPKKEIESNRCKKEQENTNHSDTSIEIEDKENKQ